MASSVRLNISVISSNEKHHERMRFIAEEFSYSINTHTDPKELLEYGDKYDLVQFVAFCPAADASFASITEILQFLKFVTPSAFICLVVNSIIKQDQVVQLKKSGCNFVMGEDQLMVTSRMEFLTSQIIRAAFLPMKVSELQPNVKLEFAVYHLLPLNQKMLPVIPRGTSATPEKLAKFDTVSELYIRREDAEKYQSYIESNTDRSAKGLSMRCRAEYLSLRYAYANFVFNLIDQSEIGSLAEGKALLTRCEGLAKNLLETLSAVGEAWEIVNNSSIGEVGSVERSPTIAAYAGLYSMNANVEKPLEVMMSCLLADIGMLDFPPSLSKKLRDNAKLEQLTADEQKIYRFHPKASVKLCLDRRLALNNNLREMILCSHERADKNGFPEGLDARRIPMGAYLVQFAELTDQMSIVRFGQPRVSVMEARKDLIETEIRGAKIFPYTFLQKIKEVI